MKAMTFFAVAAMVLFGAQLTGAFIHPTYTVDTTSSAQNTAVYSTSPTGSTSQGADTGFRPQPDSPQETIPTIPEPSTVLLVGLGLIGTGITRVRKRRH